MFSCLIICARNTEHKLGAAEQKGTCPLVRKVKHINSLKLKLNPWHYSSEEPRPTEVVAARWQYSLWLAKRISLNLNFSFLNRISLLPISYRYISSQLFSQGWVDLVRDPILPEKFLGHSQESNPGPFGWQSDVLTTIPHRRSHINS